MAKSKPQSFDAPRTNRKKYGTILRIQHYIHSCRTLPFIELKLVLNSTIGFPMDIATERGGKKECTRAGDSLWVRASLLTALSMAFQTVRFRHVHVHDSRVRETDFERKNAIVTPKRRAVTSQERFVCQKWCWAMCYWHSTRVCCAIGTVHACAISTPRYYSEKSPEGSNLYTAWILGTPVKTCLKF